MYTDKAEWDRSYENRDNFVFYPHEEVIRFVSRFIRKRIGLDEFKGVPESNSVILQGDVRALPWSAGFFRYAVSHGVLDSMPGEIARAACVELARVMQPGGLFYRDLISGDDSRHAREFSGEETVTTAHEHGTVQLYFNMAKIQTLIDGIFRIEECNLIRLENVMRGGYSSRYCLVLERI
jgi:hypothetical protein